MTARKQPISHVMKPPPLVLHPPRNFVFYHCPRHSVLLPRPTNNVLASAVSPMIRHDRPTQEGLPILAINQQPDSDFAVSEIGEGPRAVLGVKLAAQHLGISFADPESDDGADIAKNRIANLGVG